MPEPTTDDIRLARCGANAALERLLLTRTPRANGEDAPGRIAAVETLWWVRLLAEQLSYPGKELSGDGTESDASELVSALRVVRNTVTHKVPIVTVHKHAEARLGTNFFLGVTRLGGEVELCWVPVDDLPPPDPRFAKHWVEDKSDYTKHLAGEPCWGTLKRAVTWLTGDSPKFRKDGTLVVLPSASREMDELEQEPGSSGITLG